MVEAGRDLRYGPSVPQQRNDGTRHLSYQKGEARIRAQVVRALFFNSLTSIPSDPRISRSDTREGFGPAAHHKLRPETNGAVFTLSTVPCVSGALAGCGGGPAAGSLGSPIVTVAEQQPDGESGLRCLSQIVLVTLYCATPLSQVAIMSKPGASVEKVSVDACGGAMVGL